MSRLLDYQHIKKIAETNNLVLLSSNIVIKKNCNIEKERVELLLPIERIKKEYGIKLRVRFVKTTKGLNVIIERIKDLYELNKDEFSNFLETLSNIDLNTNNTEFSAMNEFDFSPEKEKKKQQNEKNIINLSKLNTLEKDNGVEKIENEIINILNNSSKSTSSPSMISQKENEETINEEKKREIINYVIEEIKNNEICFIEEVEMEYGEEAISVIIDYFSKNNDYIYDEEDQTITKA